MSLVDSETGEVVSGALVPLPADPSVLDAYADRAKFVELCLERGKEWLAEAVDNGDIEGIVEVKSRAEAIRTYTAQKQLGKDAELSAQEIVRRAERGLGLAIRKGQEEGEIRRPGQKDLHYNPRTGERSRGHDYEMVPPSDFVPEYELKDGIYPVTDGVTDQQFEEVIVEAKQEGNLSRANVVRKVKTGREKANPGPTPETTLQRICKAKEMAASGHTSRQIGAAIGVKNMSTFKARHRIEVPADAVVGTPRLHDANRITSEIVIALDASAFSIDLVDFDDLDRDQVEGWATSLSQSLSKLRGFSNRLKELTQ